MLVTGDHLPASRTWEIVARSCALAPLVLAARWIPAIHAGMTFAVVALTADKPRDVTPVLVTGDHLPASRTWEIVARSCALAPLVLAARWIPAIHAGMTFAVVALIADKPRDVTPVLVTGDHLSASRTWEIVARSCALAPLVLAARWIPAIHAGITFAVVALTADKPRDVTPVLVTGDHLPASRTWEIVARSCALAPLVLAARWIPATRAGDDVCGCGTDR